VGVGLALVDLSNVCRYDGDASWSRFEMLRQALRRRSVGRVRAIGDSSLRYRLSPPDRADLEAAVRRREVELVPYADPHLVERALADETATIVSNDRFVGLRATFPALNGFERMIRFRFDGTGPVLYPSHLEPVDAATASRAMEQDELKPLGYRTPEDRDLLRWDWRCTAATCPLGSLPQLDALPRADRGFALCPLCDEPLVQLGLAVGGIEVKLLVAGDVLERVTLATGTGVEIGRRAGTGALPVGHLLDADAARSVSRSHLYAENRHGRLAVRDLGSHNGTRVVRGDGTSATLRPGSLLLLGPEDRVSVAGVLELQASGRRWPRSLLLEQPGEVAAAMPATEAAWSP
jgi:hypothetical protein